MILSWATTLILRTNTHIHLFDCVCAPAYSHVVSSDRYTDRFDTNYMSKRVHTKHTQHTQININKDRQMQTFTYVQISGKHTQNHSKIIEKTYFKVKVYTQILFVTHSNKLATQESKQESPEIKHTDESKVKSKSIKEKFFIQLDTLNH